MLTHVVMFRLDPQRTDEATALRQKFLEMEGKIPQLQSIEVGLNVVPSNRSFDLVLITRFRTLEDMESYQVHPVHESVLAFVKQVTTQSVAVDFLS